MMVALNQPNKAIDTLFFHEKEDEDYFFES